MELVGYPEFEALSKEWIWANRLKRYNVRFANGDEYVMSAVVAGQDFREEPHATANIDKTIQRVDGKEWNSKDAMFFHLPDLAEVVEVESAQVLYRAA